MRMHHTGIVVSDLDQMVAFYSEQLGMTVKGRLESVAPAEGNHTGVPAAKRTLVFLADSQQDGHLMELVHYHEPKATEGHLDKLQLGVMHICFHVDDVQEQYERLQRAGVRFETPPKYSGAGDDRLGIVYARDPEGNWLEFLEGPLHF